MVCKAELLGIGVSNDSRKFFVFMGKAEQRREDATQSPTVSSTKPKKPTHSKKGNPPHCRQPKLLLLLLQLRSAHPLHQSNKTEHAIPDSQR
ncbi:MAG TPA: hypothetical protein VJ066_03060 [Candidatus Bathyarchaeia archaeon]|nr:hypothetical protein [Candidatus Bathyarchaeia archaeon]